MKQNECCSDCADFAFGEDTSCRNKSCHCHSPEPVESWVVALKRQCEIRGLNFNDVSYLVGEVCASQKQKQIEEFRTQIDALREDVDIDTDPLYVLDRVDDIITKLRA